MDDMIASVAIEEITLTKYLNALMNKNILVQIKWLSSKTGRENFETS